jgi:glutaminyl-peptide cyclotransferase
MNKKIRNFGLPLMFLILLIGGTWILMRFTVPKEAPPVPIAFDGEQAWRDVDYQVSLGPRIPDSQAHTKVVDWIVAQLEQAGWSTEIQEAQMMGHPVRNIIARFGEGHPWVVLGAHYDSRMLADEDPDPANRQQPVPGANDGASGVAVLLELARTLPSHMKSETNHVSSSNPIPARQIWLVFFDAEDNGRIAGWDWILGSRAFVGQFFAGKDERPDAAVVVDMIGDADLNIYREQNSDPALMDAIWSQADHLGYSGQFLPSSKYRMLDDHTPFLDAGIPAVDLIDFDYPYWHTIADTADKVSAESLKAVGDTLLYWLTNES